MPTNFPTRFDGPEESSGFLLWRMATLWQRQQRTALDQIGMTHPQFVLLASLCWLTQGNKSATQIELSQHTHIDVMTTSQVVRSMESKGWLIRKINPNDTRAKLLVPSTTGKKLVEKALLIVEQIDVDFFKVLESKQPQFQKLAKELIKANTISPEDFAHQ